jgi:hypothetical protein
MNNRTHTRGSDRCSWAVSSSRSILMWVDRCSLMPCQGVAGMSHEFVSIRCMTACSGHAADVLQECYRDVTESSQGHTCILGCSKDVRMYSIFREGRSASSAICSWMLCKLLLFFKIVATCVTVVTGSRDRGFTGAVQGWYRGGTGVVQGCYGGNMKVLQRCCKGVTEVL